MAYETRWLRSVTVAVLASSALILYACGSSSDTDFNQDATGGSGATAGAGMGGTATGGTATGGASGAATGGASTGGTEPGAGRSGGGMAGDVSMGGAPVGGALVGGAGATNAGSGNAGAAGAGAQCAAVPDPPGAGRCPEACTGGCHTGNVCEIDCTGVGECDAQMIVCPENYACLVRCVGVDACDTGTIECPPEHSCTLICREGNDACGDIDLRCGSGPCAIQCGTGAPCTGARVRCGSGACSASCAGDSAPEEMRDCNTACSCTEC